MSSNVDHPSHYNTGSIEVIDFIEDQGFGFLDGNAIKYICRYKHKGKPVEDIKKSIWYLTKLLETLEDNANGKKEKDRRPYHRSPPSCS